MWSWKPCLWIDDTELEESSSAIILLDFPTVGKVIDCYRGRLFRVYVIKYRKEEGNIKPSDSHGTCNKNIMDQDTQERKYMFKEISRFTISRARIYIPQIARHIIRASTRGKLIIMKHYIGRVEDPNNFPMIILFNWFVSMITTLTDDIINKKNHDMIHKKHCNTTNRKRRNTNKKHRTTDEEFRNIDLSIVYVREKEREINSTWHLMRFDDVPDSLYPVCVLILYNSETEKIHIFENIHGIKQRNKDRIIDIRDL